MISLKESWRVQRQQRRYEVVQRQRQVYKILEQFQQERQVKAAELREDLRLFQLELQLDMQDFLAQATSQRQIQAEELMQQLHSFAQALRQQTAQIVAVNAADRTAMSQQLRQDLSEFHAELSLSVTLLRQDLQQQMQDLRMNVKSTRVDTQELLQVYQQGRTQSRIQQIQSLTNWTATLQAEVQDYLTELSLIRHDRTHQLQTVLEIEHDRRRIEMSELFQQLAQFRSELKNYCAEIHQTVWGETSRENILVESSNGSENSNTNHNGTGNKPAIGISQVQRHGKTSVPQSNEQQSNEAAKQPAKQSAKYLATRTSKQLPAAQGAKPKTSLGSLRTMATQASNAQPLATLSPHTDVPPERLSPSQPSLPDPIEQQVYAHIHQTHGARLTDIEAALQINRFQAVDALRSLIKKGLVTQRDRIYFIQEELSL